MIGMRSDALSADKVALLREMASDGFGVAEIAEVAECGKATVARYAGNILARNKAAGERARRAQMLRMIRANDAAVCPEDRDEIAARFGIANRHSLRVRVVYAKRKLGLLGPGART